MVWMVSRCFCFRATDSHEKSKRLRMPRDCCSAWCVSSAMPDPLHTLATDEVTSVMFCSNACFWELLNFWKALVKNSCNFVFV